MDLLDIQLRKVNRDKILSSPEKLLLCKRLSNVDQIQANTIFRLIRNFKIKFDKVARIGDDPSKIPYFGEDIPEVGLVFSAKCLPEQLLVVLENFVEEVEPKADYLGDEDDLMFILAGIHGDDRDVPTNTSHKFQIKGKKRGMKVENVTDHSGYKVMIAYTGNNDFESDTKSKYCFWDGQEFDGKPICIPYKYEVKNGIHTFSGTKCFCSIFCMYAHLTSEFEKMAHNRDSRLERAMQLTMIAFRLMFPNEKQIKPAPKRESIDIFGGALALEEYRRQSNQNYVNASNVFFNEVQSAEFIF
jgi:hypothetical protein